MALYTYFSIYMKCLTFVTPDILQEHVDTLTSEFKSEVELLAKIEHRNLVRLLGYVDKGHERLIITEFVPNGTLREHLDGKAFNPESLSHLPKLQCSVKLQ